VLPGKSRVESPQEGRPLQEPPAALQVVADGWREDVAPSAWRAAAQPELRRRCEGDDGGTCWFGRLACCRSSTWR